jgi:hypothetical protein
MKAEVSDLKPCPFCGADALMWSWNYGTAIQCSKFNAKSHLIQVIGKTSTEAIEQWNTRRESEDEG